MELISKKEGMIPSNTWDTYIEIGFKALHSGDARFCLREAMLLCQDTLPNVVMLVHGKEPWTSNIHREEHSPVLVPYKTKMEIRIFARSLLRARQELAKLMKLWEINAKRLNMYRIYRLKDIWSEGDNENVRTEK